MSLTKQSFLTSGTACRTRLPSLLYPSQLSTTSRSTCTPIRHSTRPSTRPLLMSSSHGKLSFADPSNVSFGPVAETTSPTGSAGGLVCTLAIMWLELAEGTLSVSLLGLESLRDGRILRLVTALGFQRCCVRDVHTVHWVESGGNHLHSTSQLQDRKVPPGENSPYQLHFQILQEHELNQEVRVQIQILGMYTNK